MKHTCSLILDITGKGTEWSWLLFHRSANNESISLGIKMPQAVLPADIVDSFNLRVTRSDLVLLRKWGCQLSNDILPKELIKELVRYTDGDILFRVPPEWADIPFELCCLPDRGFLCTLFETGTIINFQNDAISKTRSSPVDRTKSLNDSMLILADVSDTVPSAQQECIKLRDLTKKRGFLVHYIAQGDKTKILDAIEHSSFVHFAGHSTPPDQGRLAGWELGSGCYITSDDIQTIGSASVVPRLIFSNSCHAGSCGSLQRLSGIAGAFLKAGVPQIIGPVKRVNDKEALQYALLFYRELFRRRRFLNRLKPAQSMLKTRQAMLDQNPQSVTPLFYRLYGDPQYSIPKKTGPRLAYVSGKRIAVPALIIVFTVFLYTQVDIKRYVSSFCSTASYTLFSTAEDKAIARAGIKTWNRLIADYKKKGLFVEGKSAAVITRNISSYKGKYMIFPEIDYAHFYKGYYHYTEPGTRDYFLIRDNEAVGHAFFGYSTVIGNLTDTKCQCVGIIRDATTAPLKNDPEGMAGIDNPDQKKANIVIMEIIALYAEEKAVVTIEGGKTRLVGEEFIEKKLARMEKKASLDIPKQAARIDQQTDPLVIAKLFFYLSSGVQNREAWEQCLSKNCFSSPELADIFWNRLIRQGSGFFYIRTSADTTERKKYYFQPKINGIYSDTPVSIEMAPDQGSWKVDAVYW